MAEDDSTDLSNINFFDTDVVEIGDYLRSLGSDITGTGSLNDIIKGLGNVLAGTSSLGKTGQYAGLLGIAGLASKLFGSSGGGGFAGYQGKIPTYTASRTMNTIPTTVPNPLAGQTGQPATIPRRPGSGGITYFSPMVYTPVVTGGGGNDTVAGGAGNDVVTGAAGGIMSLRSYADGGNVIGERTAATPYQIYDKASDTYRYVDAAGYNRWQQGLPIDYNPVQGSPVYMGPSEQSNYNVGTSNFDDTLALPLIRTLDEREADQLLRVSPEEQKEDVQQLQNFLLQNSAFYEDGSVNPYATIENMRGVNPEVANEFGNTAYNLVRNVQGLELTAPDIFKSGTFSSEGYISPEQLAIIAGDYKASDFAKMIGDIYSGVAPVSRSYTFSDLVPVPVPNSDLELNTVPVPTPFSIFDFELVPVPVPTPFSVSDFEPTPVPVPTPFSVSDFELVPVPVPIDLYGGGAASGGIMSLRNGHLGSYSDGGQLLRGPGDGVSDDIPATIADRQPARLADGEFVIPARIVSELGNGSTEAGARKLYAMMDRIKNARRKAKDIAADTKTDRYLPR